MRPFLVCVHDILPGIALAILLAGVAAAACERDPCVEGSGGGSLEDETFPQLCRSDKLEISPQEIHLGSGATTDGGDGSDAASNAGGAERVRVSVIGVDHANHPREAAHVTLRIKQALTLVRLESEGSGCTVLSERMARCALDPDGAAGIDVVRATPTATGTAELVAESGLLRERARINVHPNTAGLGLRFDAPADSLPSGYLVETLPLVCGAESQVTPGKCSDMRAVPVALSLRDVSSGVLVAPGSALAGILAVAPAGLAGAHGMSEDDSCDTVSPTIPLTFLKSSPFSAPRRLCVGRNGGTFELAAQAGPSLSASAKSEVPAVPGALAISSAGAGTAEEPQQKVVVRALGCDGAPLPEVVIRWQANSGGPVASAVTSSWGGVEFTLAAPGGVAVIASLEVVDSASGKASKCPGAFTFGGGA